MTSIFTPLQKTIFEALCDNKFITQNFRFAGGTALSEFYLKHRYSEDLDFFTGDEIIIENIKPILSPVFRNIGIETMEYREATSSKIFFLKKGEKEKVKTDFNFWPFKRFEKGKIYKGLEIESLFDIALSKLDAILTRSRARDFVDFYFIQKEKVFDLEMMLKKLEEKTNWKMDHLFIGSCFLKIEKLQDYPKMIKPFSKEEMVKYFFTLAEAQKDKIVY
ncbi:MAG: nucleotidyl transferase AbiEii/AbiGii toxin family protein [Minisyncoccales bacterium]